MRIFNLAKRGYGFQAIAKKLNQDKIPPLGKSNFWHPSYIQKTLRNRACIGEHQPYTSENGERSPVGSPVFGYYPEIIKPELFATVQNAIATRRNQRGRVTAKVSNLFTGVVHERTKIGNVVVTIPCQYREKNHTGRLQAGDQLTPGIRYDHLEKVVLWWLCEVKLHLGNDEHQNLTKRADDLRKRIKTLEERMDEDDDLTSLLDKLSSWKKELKTTEKAIEETAVPLDQKFLASKELIRHLAANNTEDVRRELRGLIRQTIKRIDLTVEGEKRKQKHIDLIVTFEDGSKRGIYYRTRQGLITACGILTHDGKVTLASLDALGTLPEFPVDEEKSSDLKAKAKALKANGESIKETAATLQIHRVTVYRWCKPIRP
jgi:hypothetical protein